MSAALNRYESIALVLQGGGALGAYQAGVYEGLAEAGIEPNWFAGTSIGAINAAIIAGNAPRERVARLRAFWETVSRSLTPSFDPAAFAGLFPDPRVRALADQWSAARAMWSGQQGFFSPRVPPSWAWPPGSDGAISLYDTAPLRATLDKLVDWNLLNRHRVTVGAVEVETGNFHYFNSWDAPLGVDHVVASGALPPAFAPVKLAYKDHRGIGREGHFWDGGLVSNTPLEPVLDSTPRRDTLAFQIDLWSAKGDKPRDLADVLEREKDIRFSSRTRRGGGDFARQQSLRHLLARVLAKMPPGLRDDAEVRELAVESCTKVMKIVQLIYRDKDGEAYHKDYEFGRTTMNEHWYAGLKDVRETLADDRALAWPGKPVETYDHHRDEKLK